MTDEQMKNLARVDLARLRELASGRDEWFAMGREEKSYFINFGDEWNAVRWMDDQKKRMAEWVEREGVHLVKQHVFSELEELANAAANEIEALRAILQAATSNTLSADAVTRKDVEDFLDGYLRQMWTEVLRGPSMTGIGGSSNALRNEFLNRFPAIAASAPKGDGND